MIKQKKRTKKKIVRNILIKYFNLDKLKSNLNFNKKMIKNK